MFKKIRRVSREMASRPAGEGGEGGSSLVPLSATKDKNKRVVVTMAGVHTRGAPSGATQVPQGQGGGGTRSTDGGGQGGGGSAVNQQRQSQQSQQSAGAAATAATTATETKSEIMKRITMDRPYDKLKTNHVDVIKRVTAKQIFPYSKFLMKEQEVNAAYVQLAFVEMNWTGKTPNMIVAHAKAWRLVALEIMKRCGERRSRTLTEFAKACKGMTNQ